MAEVSSKILQIIAQKDAIDTLDIAKLLNVDHQKIIGATKSLHSLPNVCCLLYAHE